MIWTSGIDKLCNYANERCVEFLGKPVGSILGNGWTESIHSNDLEQSWDTYTGALDRREPFQMEYRLRRHDGEYRSVIDSGVPRFSAHGSFAGYIGTAIDVTERKQAEQALSTVNQRLIEAHEEERARIARELHDDISQRLALLAIQLDGFEQDRPISAADFTSQIQEIRKKAQDLVSDIQDLSHRLHSSKLEFLGLVAATAGFCRELSDRQGVEIEFHSENIPKGLPREISLCLFRVLQEALQNATKYSGSRQFQVSLRGSANKIELTVHDWGIGFEPEEAIKGHGLGLTSMRERLKLVDGHLSIVSKPHDGTTIHARVPVHRTRMSAGVG